MTQSAVAESEKLYGKFVPVKDYDGLWKVGKENSALQINADIHLDSDPICSSSGCDQYKHPERKDGDWPINYDVPNFGMDRDIHDSFANLDTTQKRLDHIWTWKDKPFPKRLKWAGDGPLDSDIINT